MTFVVVGFVVLRGALTLCLHEIDAQSSRLGEFGRLGNVLQYLPRHARPLGDVHCYKECLVAREQLCRRSPARLALEIDIRQRLLVAISHDETSLGFLDRPWRRETAAFWHCYHAALMILQWKC